MVIGAVVVVRWYTIGMIVVNVLTQLYARCTRSVNVLAITTSWRSRKRRRIWCMLGFLLGFLLGLLLSLRLTHVNVIGTSSHHIYIFWVAATVFLDAVRPFTGAWKLGPLVGVESNVPGTTTSTRKTIDIANNHNIISIVDAQFMKSQFRKPLVR
jgi:hypothetical protein